MPISVTFLVFQFDISGNDIKLEQLENNAFSLFIFLVFHFDISGNDFKLEQSWKIPTKSFIFFKSHLEISSMVDNDVQ